jgi:hypothetical protein
MPELDSSLSALLRAQHADGGWGYGPSSSWVEPTCYAILALRTAADGAAAAGANGIARAGAWLAKLQRPDGGFAPTGCVAEATAVTSLVILALSGMERYREMLAAAVRWLAGFRGAENSPLIQVLRTVLGKRSAATDHGAWPWYPGTASWVVPTSLTILALQKHLAEPLPADIVHRISEARLFLLVRRCRDHGWNHGGITVSNEVPFSYPETTGIALLALKGYPYPGLSASLDRAEELYRDVPSAEGEYWLRMALLAHGRTIPARSTEHRDWNVNSVALRVIAQSAETGKNPLLQAAFQAARA